MKKRVLYYDVLNIAACLAVIAMHHNGVVHTYSDSLMWKTALIVEVGAYWAVPIFLMISGATLMNYREKYDTKTFFQKRLLRTVIPFFAWSAIVLVWKTAVTGVFQMEEVNLRTVLNALLNNQMESKYWFFPTIISFYLMMPVLSWLTEEKHRPTLRYVVIAMFILQSTMPPVCRLLGITWNSSFSLASMSNLIIYIFLGYLLANTEFSARERRWIYLFGAAGAVIRYVGVYVLSTADGEKNTIFFNSGYFPAVMLACAVFVWAKSVNWERVMQKLPISKEQIAKISACSLGIYLIHDIVMHYELELLRPFGMTTGRVVWRTLFIPVTYLISFAAVSLMKRVPGLRRLVP